MDANPRESASPRSHEAHEGGNREWPRIHANGESVSPRSDPPSLFEPWRTGELKQDEQRFNDVDSRASSRVGAFLG